MGALPDGSDFPKIEFDALLLIAVIGLTTPYNGFSLDLSYHDFSEEEDSFPVQTMSKKFNGDRQDYSATPGMRILDNRGNVYIGYKKGKTTGCGEAGTQLTFEESGFLLAPVMAGSLPTRAF